MLRIGLLAAGRLAARRSANSEAVAHLRREIAAVRGLPETVERNRLELALQLALGPALLSSRGFGDAEASTGYQRAAELARRLGDCQRRSKNASAGRSKNTSAMLARRPPNWGSFR